MEIGHKKQNIFFWGFVIFISLAGPVFAQEEEGAASQSVLKRLTVIEERIKKIETHQQEILARQDKILAELDRLRVWVQRR